MVEMVQLCMGVNDITNTGKVKRVQKQLVERPPIPGRGQQSG